jgi:hypothetical protein
VRRADTGGQRWRRRAAAIACTAALVSGCQELGLEEAGTPVEPPRLAFAATAYDFGRVAQGTPIEHQFAFANDGGSELTIMNLRAACDCRATVIGGGELAPHGRGAVQARFDTDAVFGPQRRTVTVYSNDPVQRAVTLTLTGEVALDVAADPAQVYLGVVPPGAAAIRDVTVRLGGDGLRVGPLTDPAPVPLALQLADAPLDIHAVTLTIGTAPGAPLGPFSTVIRIPTTSARHPILQIPVTGIIAADAPTPRPRTTVPTPTPTAAADDAPGAGE